MKYNYLFEVWRTVIGYEGLYEVSNFGRVRSLTNNTILKLTLTSKGYYRVQLSNNGNRKKYFVHRLVAQAFIPNPKNKSEVE